MSQELQVVRCYSCQTFQVHIVKKSKKWECKMCGEKQSLKKVYGRGSGKDCRRHVQLLNEMQVKENEETPSINFQVQEIAFQEEKYETSTMGPYESHEMPDNESPCTSLNTSKWSKYLDEPKGEEIDDEDHIVTTSETNETCSTSTMNHMIKYNIKEENCCSVVPPVKKIKKYLCDQRDDFLVLSRKEMMKGYDTKNEDIYEPTSSSKEVVTEKTHNKTVSTLYGQMNNYTSQELDDILNFDV